MLDSQCDLKKIKKGFNKVHDICMSGQCKVGRDKEIGFADD